MNIRLIPFQCHSLFSHQAAAISALRSSKLLFSRLFSTTQLFTLLFCCASATAQSSTSFDTTAFTIPHGVQRLTPVDLNNDGLKDLVASDGVAIHVYLQQPNNTQLSFNFSQPSASISLTAQAVGWDVLDDRILAIVDGKQVRAWEIDTIKSKTGNSSINSNLVSTVILDDLDAYLPPGVYPLQFVQDINGDGMADFVIPTLDALELFFQKKSMQKEGVQKESAQQENGEFFPGIKVRSQNSLQSELRVRENLNVFVGQQITIPQLTARDVNNDKRNDLLVSNEDWLEVYLANTQGGYPDTPSYALDRKAIKSRVGEVDYDNIDYANLSGLLAHTYEFRLQDLDDDKIEDMVVREGGRVIVYGGTPTGMNFAQPRQVLKSAGNVMGINLRDEDGDGLEDLWLTRIEAVSVGNIFLWLAVSGSVDTETFIYKNTGKEFSKRPHRKITVTLAFPSLFRSADLVMSAAEKGKQSDKGRAVFARVAGDKQQLDVIQIRENGVAVFTDFLSEFEEQLFMGAMDYSLRKNEYTVDLEKTLRNPASGKGDQRRLVDDVNPSFIIPFAKTDGAGKQENLSAMNAIADLAVADLNGDGVDEIFIVSERTADKLVGWLLFSTQS